jgi:hypothetical protein
MKTETSMKLTIKSIFVPVAIAFATICVQASPLAKGDFLVQTLSTSPDFLRNTSEDLMLHDSGDGSTYLYVEQQHGTILSIFDVTNPGRMKLTKSVRTEEHGSYDFVAPLGGSAELISFRNGSGTAVLDLRKEKNPHMTQIGGSSALPTEFLGTAGYLSPGEHTTQAVSEQLQDIQLVETDQFPRLQTTIHAVKKQITRAETGTIFFWVTTRSQLFVA